MIDRALVQMKLDDLPAVELLDVVSEGPEGGP